MRNPRILIFLLLAYCLQACPGYDDDIVPNTTVYNSGTEDIYFLYDFTNVTLTAADFDAPGQDNFIELDSFKKFSLDLKQEDFYCTVLIFNKSTLENYSWQEIQDGNMYDKKYELTYEQLMDMKNKIIYTGN